LYGGGPGTGTNTLTEALCINAEGATAGNVGIGTSSPGNKLTALSTSATATVAKFAATNYGNLGTTYIELGTQLGDGGSRIGNINPTGNNGTLVFETMTGTSGVFAERLRIDSAGNVGIGTSSPNQTGFTAPVLSITNGTSGIVELIGTQAADGTVGQVAFYNTSSSVRIAQILGVRSGANNSGALTFQTNNAGTLGEAARITSGGGLLVGTTSTNGAVSNTKRITGGTFSSFNGSLTSLTSGVAYTMFTMTADFTTYLVTVSGIASNTAYSETAIVHLNNTSVSVTIIADGGSIAISNSGLDVQVTQSSGVTLNDLEWSATRLL
jgi:hypothetical protein